MTQRNDQAAVLLGRRLRLLLLHLRLQLRGW
jgi:hypothetical protein